MASSSSSSPKFDVFLSFRGETRKRFTSHLNDGLKRNGIKTFMDEDDLKKGDKITPTICRAIAGSAVCIPVISPGYADSRWCLMELAMMVKCEKRIIPIFFDVEPSAVRHQRGPFEAAFQRHQFRYGEEIAMEWKKAMAEVADISGYDNTTTANGYESTLVNMIIERILSVLGRGPLDVGSSGHGRQAEPEINPELQAIEEQLRQQNDPYLRELDLHRKQKEMVFREKTRKTSSLPEKKQLQQELDAFLEQIQVMKVAYCMNHMSS